MNSESNVIIDAITTDLELDGYSVDRWLFDGDLWIVSVNEAPKTHQAVNEDLTQAYVDVYKLITDRRNDKIEVDLHNSKKDEKFYNDLKTLIKSLLEGTNDISHTYHGSSEYKLCFGWRVKELMNSVVFQVDERIRKYHPQLLDEINESK